MKRILMFCPRFFGYDQKIAEALRQQGHLVDLYDERVSNGVLAKTCIRYDVSLFHPVMERYIARIMAENADKQYDYIFVIKGEGLTRRSLKALRQAYPKAKLILYLWDSLDNIADGVGKLKLYDRALTFDPQDAKNYPMVFRPLFYHAGFAGAGNCKDFAYDIAFIGTAHSSRPRIVKELTRQCAAQGRKVYSYLFTPHYFVYLYNKLLNKEYRSVSWAELETKPLPSQTVRQVYDTSRCVLDVEHGRQRGLTIRTIEMLGMEKKVITTNRLIADYDFYHPNNFLIIDRDRPSLDMAFLDTDYTPLPKAIQEKYSLNSFLEEIFEFGVEAQ